MTALYTESIADSPCRTRCTRRAVRGTSRYTPAALPCSNACGAAPGNSCAAVLQRSHGQFFHLWAVFCFLLYHPPQKAFCEKGRLLFPDMVGGA